MKLLNSIKRLSLLLVFGFTLFSCEHELFSENDEPQKVTQLCLQRGDLDSDSSGTDRSNICPLTQD